MLTTAARAASEHVPDALERGRNPTQRGGGSRPRPRACCPRRSEDGIDGNPGPAIRQERQRYAGPQPVAAEAPAPPARWVGGHTAVTLGLERLEAELRGSVVHAGQRDDSRRIEPRILVDRCAGQPGPRSADSLCSSPARPSAPGCRQGYRARGGVWPCGISVSRRPASDGARRAASRSTATTACVLCRTRSDRRRATSGVPPRLEELEGAAVLPRLRSPLVATRLALGRRARPAPVAARDVVPQALVLGGLRGRSSVPLSSPVEMPPDPDDAPAGAIEQRASPSPISGRTILSFGTQRRATSSQNALSLLTGLLTGSRQRAALHDQTGVIRPNVWVPRRPLRKRPFSRSRQTWQIMSKPLARLSDAEASRAPRGDTSRSALRLWFPGTSTISRLTPPRGIPNGSPVPCTTSVGDRVQLGLAALLGATRRVERKRQAQDGYRPGLGGRPAGDTRAQRPAAGDQRQVLQLLAEAIDDRRPCSSSRGARAESAARKPRRAARPARR